MRRRQPRIEDMTAEELAAYWKRQARKWEHRVKELRRITGGKHGDDLRADLDELARLRHERTARTNTDNRQGA